MTDTRAYELCYEAFKKHMGAQRFDTEGHLLYVLQNHHANYHVARTIPTNSDLLGFAKAGQAVAVRRFMAVDDATRLYKLPKSRLDSEPGRVEEELMFGCWEYQWQGHSFLVYEVTYKDQHLQKNRILYVLEPRGSEDQRESNSTQTEQLLLAAGAWTRELHGEIWVFDDASWHKNKSLWESVQSSSWDDVILDFTTKRKLIQDVQGFFDNQSIYEKFKMPWKRGVIFYGVPGNGKTISIKALMNTLASRPRPVQSLYIKSLESCSGPKWSIQQIFAKARRMAPCLLIFEDLDSLVTDKTRSYFLNEIDGIESNDGILMIGSTNHLDRLDPAITKRPSRFDRKYHFKVPSEDERIAYCRYWQAKFDDSDVVDFPDEVCPIVAKFTEGYSFAYLKELFVTSLLALARGPTEPDECEVAESGSRSPPDSETIVVEKNTGGDGDTDGKEPAEEKDHSDKKCESCSAKKPAKAPLVMPEVEIPVSLVDCQILRVLKSQAALLLEEINNADEDAVTKGGCAAPPDPFAYLRRMAVDDD